MRFYEFQSGHVLLDGVDIRDYSQEELRKNIGLVLQDPFLYHGTIKSNIAMYQDISDEEVQAAAAFVDADSFIQDLPQGYDAPFPSVVRAFLLASASFLPLIEQSPVSLKS